MSPSDAARAYEAFCAGPTPEELMRYLPDLAERTAAQLLELHRAPTPERCERMAIELEGARHLCLRLREVLREGAAGVER